MYVFFMNEAGLWDFSDKIKLSWEEYFNTSLLWNNVYSSIYKLSIDSNTRMFQYKLLFKFLPVNKTLYQWGILDSPTCSLCKEEEESVIHLFCDCPVSAQFWSQVDDWFFCITKNHLHINALSIIFGSLREQCPVLSNLIILLGKIFIFKNRKYGLNMPAFKLYVAYFYKLEQNIAYRQGKHKKHRGKWGHFNMILSK